MILDNATSCRRSRSRGAALALALALVVTAGGPCATLAAVIDTYVGGGNGDGNAAINAVIDPRGLIAVGSSSAPDLYIADGLNDLVRRVDGATGLIETIAGNGVHGYGGDGGSARNASLSLPLDVARDGAGNLYIADMSNNRIRKVTPTGQISTFAGTGALAYGGDGGLATRAALNKPYAVAVGPDGNIYIADFGNSRIRRVGPQGCSPSSCVIDTVVGNGVHDFSGDGGPVLNASLNNPADVTFDGTGNMLIADWGNHRIRRVANGIINTVAGGGYSPGSIGDGGPATSAVLIFPTQVATDSAGNIFIADSQQRRIRMVQASTQVITTVAGDGDQGTSGDGGPAVAAALNPTYGVVATTANTFWLTQTAGVDRSIDNRVRRVTNGTITSVVGGGLGSAGPAYDARVEPHGAQATLGQGVVPDLYFADGGNNVVRYVNGATGNIFTLAGTGVAAYSGDNGAALDATLNDPRDVAVDASGTVYVADTANHAVRRIRNGIIDTVAGNGRRGYGGDGGAATAAQLSSPTGLAIDGTGRLYIADSGNNRVRRVSNGIISTIAGNGVYGFGGDGGPATGASLRSPWDVAVAGDGTVFISDTWNYRVRVVDPGGIITTYAGVGYSGFGGDGGPALAAVFYAPNSLSLDNARRLFVTDSLNERVRMIDNSPLHVISTVAGNGQHGFSGDGGSATAASISDPSGVAIDPLGQTMFVSSDFDGRVRMVSFGGAAPTPTATPAGTPTPQQAVVSGAVTYYSNQEPVPAVDVHLVFGSYSATVQTSAQGLYSASLPAGTWGVAPAKTGAFGTAVSALDAARVLQALAGQQHLTEQQRLACDTTGDGSLSALDAVYILQFSAGRIDRLPAATLCGSDWIFYPEPATAPNQTIVPPALTGGTCQKGGILFTPLTGVAAGQNIDGILLGDCTGNWTAAGASLRRRASGGAVVHAGSPRQGRGNRFTIPIYVKATTPFHAMDLRLRYDAASTFVGTSVRGDGTGALTSTRAAGGELAVSLASADPIGDRRGSILMLQFHGANPALILDGALVDEEPARVVTHRR